jgi:hypothetical protein
MSGQRSCGGSPPLVLSVVGFASVACIAGAALPVESVLAAGEAVEELLVVAAMSPLAPVVSSMCSCALSRWRTRENDREQ